MDRSALTAFRQTVVERRLGVYAVHVYQAGRRPLTHRFRSDDRVNLYSIAKTFTSLAIGLARAEGRLDLDDRVLNYFPQFAAGAGAGMDEVTIGHLLTMTTGNEYYWFGDDRIVVPDLAQDILARPRVHRPGAHFAYTGAGAYLLGRIIHTVTGVGLREYLLPRLFDPLDIHNPQWHRCSLGHPFAESGLFLRSGELARLGELLVHDGVYRGRQVIPADYVRAMCRDWVDSSPFSKDPESSIGYGLGVWRCSKADAWRADGKYGQFVVILPNQQASVTITGHHEGINSDILRAIWADILPILN